MIFRVLNYSRTGQETAMDRIYLDPYKALAEATAWMLKHNAHSSCVLHRQLETWYEIWASWF